MELDNAVERRELIQVMHKNGLSIENIAHSTNFSIEEIQQIIGDE